MWLRAAPPPPRPPPPRARNIYAGQVVDLELKEGYWAAIGTPLQVRRKIPSDRNLNF